MEIIHGTAKSSALGVVTRVLNTTRYSFSYAGMKGASVPVQFRLTKTSIRDYARKSGLEESEAKLKLESRILEASKVRVQDNGLTVYRMRGSHHWDRYRCLVSPDGSVTRVLPEHSGNRKRG